MKKNLIIIAIVFAIPIIAYWLLTSSNTTNANTNVANKPQIIKFTSKMCLDCQTMNKILKELYPKYQDDVVLTEINVENGNSFNEEQMQKYNVTLVPTIILLNSDGSQSRRIEGAISKEKMEECIQRLK